MKDIVSVGIVKYAPKVFKDFAHGSSSAICIINERTFDLPTADRDYVAIFYIFIYNI